MSATLAQHLDRTRTPKRILALDGGGIRGVLTLEFLAGIESLLRKRTARPALVLSDYFDLIGGTSTGAIIAAALACGNTVDELRTLYRELGHDVFQASVWRQGYLAAKFPAERVRDALDRHLGADTMLGGDRLRTGLMVMTKRLDTGSPWPLHNHPEGRYAAQDGRLLLSQVVRASTAAPTYFAPEEVTIESRGGSTVRAAFVDGGVSPFNDPALQLLMVAALEGHGFRWPTGEHNILLISVGTGAYKKTFTGPQIGSMPAAKQGLVALESLMDDCGRVNRTMLQWMTRCLTPWVIDRAVGDLCGDSAAGPRLASYARYEVLLEPTWLEHTLGLQLSPEDVKQLAQMDDPSRMEQLATLGAAGARTQIADTHFPGAFDLTA